MEGEKQNPGGRAGASRDCLVGGSQKYNNESCGEEQCSQEQLEVAGMFEPAFADTREATLALLNLGHRLTPKAGRFLGQLVAEDTPLTELTDKQLEWLTNLLDKAGLPPLVASDGR